MVVSSIQNLSPEPVARGDSQDAADKDDLRDPARVHRPVLDGLRTDLRPDGNGDSRMARRRVLEEVVDVGGRFLHGVIDILELLAEPVVVDAELVGMVNSSLSAAAIASSSLSCWISTSGSAAYVRPMIARVFG
jgi:hypothetical protein